MALILSLETSSSGCSVALHKEGELISLRETTEPQSAASKLAVMIDEVLSLNSMKAKDLHAVSVTKGPGSYTGLRIGVSTAKGLGYALSIPLISINSLELLAHQVRSINKKNHLLCPMLDARRMEVYTMLLDSDLNILESVNAKILEGNSYYKWLSEKEILFFGSGSEKYDYLLNDPRAIFIKGIVPSAAAMGEISFAKFVKNEFEDLKTFEPFYLKEFVAKKPKLMI